MKYPLNLLFAILYLAALALLAHPLGQALPRRLFREDRFPFASFRWEQNGTVYKKLWIEKWKDILPDMSRVLSDMLPKQITEATPEQMKLLENIDILVDGPFLMEQRTLEARFRGSKNQRIINVPQSLKEHRAVLETAERWVGESK